MLIDSRASLQRVVRCFVLIAAFQPALEHTAVGQESATISDVGEWAWDLRDSDTIDRIFKYDGLLVSGELSVQDYRDARDAVQSSLQADEHPSLFRMLNNPKDANSGFLTVRTVHGWDREQGRVIYLRRTDGRFRVVGESFWIA